MESALDEWLLGLERTGDHSVRFELVGHLCRPDGALYGGTAIAAAVASMELVTGRPALWATTQLVTRAQFGEVVDVAIESLARGTYIDQVRTTATIDGRILFTALGSTATGRRDGISGLGAQMPAVTPPDESEARVGNRRWGTGELGHHRVTEMRTAARLDGDVRAGHQTVWARVVDASSRDGGASVDTTTAAKLGFLADMVPVAVCDAAGVRGAGTSLDNSLRIGRLVDCDWVLLDMHGHTAADGYGYGDAHLWSPDGVLLGTGSQTAKLFGIDSSLGDTDE